MKSKFQLNQDRLVHEGYAEWRKEKPHKDALILKLCMQYHRDRHEDYANRAAHRRSYLRCLKELAEDGEIAIVYGFRDCDMAVSDGNVQILPATKEAVREWEEEFYRNAEGPQWWNFERPSVARGIHSTSRDLALEAFEDGHAHSVSECRYDEDGDYYA